MATMSSDVMPPMRAVSPHMSASTVEPGPVRTFTSPLDEPPTMIQRQVGDSVDETPVQTPLSQVPPLPTTHEPPALHGEPSSTSSVTQESSFGSQEPVLHWLPPLPQTGSGPSTQLPEPSQLSAPSQNSPS